VKFIRLTREGVEAVVWVRVEAILAIQESKQGTRVDLHGGHSYHVQEAVEEIYEEMERMRTAAVVER
jgi:hypothetical protein